MTWENYERATPPTDLLDLEQSSCPAGLTMLNDAVLGRGPFAINTLQDYEASTASHPLSEDMLFDPGSNIAWLQNLNLDFLWALVRAPSVPAGPAVQPSSTQGRITLYKIVGRVSRRNSMAWFRTTTPHVEAWDQTAAMMGKMHFHVHAGKYWSMKSTVFSSTGKMLMMELECRKMSNHVIKMDRVPGDLVARLESRLGRR
jgi:hypothetical protein